MSSTPRLQDQFTLLLVRLCCSLYSSFLNQSLLLYQLLSYLNFNGLYFKPSIIFKFANLICNIPFNFLIFILILTSVMAEVLGLTKPLLKGKGSFITIDLRYFGTAYR